MRLQKVYVQAIKLHKCILTCMTWCTSDSIHDVHVLISVHNKSPSHSSFMDGLKQGQKSSFNKRYYSVDFTRTDHAKVASAYRT